MGMVFLRFALFFDFDQGKAPPPGREWGGVSRPFRPFRPLDLDAENLHQGPSCFALAGRRLRLLGRRRKDGWA